VTLCRGSKVLVAANLHDSAALMPHYTLQLLALLAALPRGSAFLSVYESGSTDDTGTPFPAPSHSFAIWFRAGQCEVPQTHAFLTLGSSPDMQVTC